MCTQQPAQARSLLTSVHRLHPSPATATEPFTLAVECDANDLNAVRESVGTLTEFANNCGA